METAYINDRFVQENNIDIDDFNRYWIAYKWCAKMEQKFKCGCGAVLKPKWPDPENVTDRSKISMLAAGFYKHIDTPKHKHSIAVQLQFLEHLEQKFKKDVFYDEHENFEKERYEEFQAYERDHKAYILKRRQEDGFKKWLRREEDRIRREEEAERMERNRTAMKDFIKTPKTDLS